MAKTCLPASMLSSSSIAYVKVFPAPQIFSKYQMLLTLRVVYLLFLLCFYLLFRLFPAVVLTLETSEVCAIFVFTIATKTTQPCPQVFSVTVPKPVGHFLVKHTLVPEVFLDSSSREQAAKRLRLVACSLFREELKKNLWDQGMLNTKFFQVWSSVSGYGELCVFF